MIEKLIEDWVEEEGLEAILEEADMTEEEVVRILYQGGHLALPVWLTRYYEDELSSEAE